VVASRKKRQRKVVVEEKEEAGREEWLRRQAAADELLREPRPKEEWHITGESPKFWARLFVTEEGLVENPPSSLWWTHRKRWSVVKDELKRRGWHGRRVE
jgi:hypothetical protein